MLNNLFCKLGWHRPLKRHIYNFTDLVSGKVVYNARCSCGLKWNVDSSKSGFSGHKMLCKNQHRAGY